MMKIELEDQAVTIDGVRYVKKPNASHLVFDNNGNIVGGRYVDKH